MRNTQVVRQLIRYLAYKHNYPFYCRIRTNKYKNCRTVKFITNEIIGEKFKNFIEAELNSWPNFEFSIAAHTRPPFIRYLSRNLTSIIIRLPIEY